MEVRPVGFVRVLLKKLITWSIGYSWKANQYGLSIDSVVAFELVKPDGTILQVTKDAHPDLFFGLKVCCSIRFVLPLLKISP